MDTFSETCSMYEAAKLNISRSKIEPAVSFYGKEYSFGQVFSLIDTLADNLSAEFGIGKGSAVTLCVPNSPAAVFAFYAANKLGAAVNLVHPFLPPEKLKESAEKSNSKLIVVYDLYPCAGFEFGVPLLVSDSAAYMGAGAKLYYRLTQKRKARGISFEKYLKERGNPHVGAAQFGAREAAVYLASGGTAGEPKTIAHCNAVCNNLCAKAQEFLGEPLEHYTALYNVLPIFHGYGLCINMHMCMIMRRTNVMCLKFDAKRSAKEIVKSGANILTGVPTMYIKPFKGYLGRGRQRFSPPDRTVQHRFGAAGRERAHLCRLRFDRNGGRVHREHPRAQPCGLGRLSALRHRDRDL